MLPCFSTEESNEIVSIVLINKKNLTAWLDQQTLITKEWVRSLQFRAEPGQLCLLPHASGKLAQVICGTSDQFNLWDVGHLPYTLPAGIYSLTHHHEEELQLYILAWGLGSYQFTRYKKANHVPAKLHISTAHLDHIHTIVESIHDARDWINTPTEDMGPSEFSDIAQQIAAKNGAAFKEIIGEELIKENFISIHTVGRASDDAPRLLDLRWGDNTHLKLTLVGKGVCFDSGGLDIKLAPYMLLMKKDMAGGAHVLALAHMIMQAKLPVCLRVLIPVVENVISGNAYRPGDVIKSRQGLTIEIGNTDAEGRVILADALTEAVSEKPDLLIDISTLTGAARVALGTDIPVVFSNHDEIVSALIKEAEKVADPMWRLPLYQPYRELINSSIADINNNSTEPYGGAITAALFLQAFVPNDVPWLHFDLMAWNLRARPGRPQGGEAMGLRALFSYICHHFK